jgi:hypothetical protein
MAGLEIDTSELNQLAVDLGRVPARAIPDVEATLKKGAQNLKESMAAAFEGSQHFRRVGAAVSYERLGFAREIAYEIGPEIGRGAGSLGGIAVDGGANGGGGSVSIDGLLEPEAGALEKYIGQALEKAL